MIGNIIGGAMDIAGKIGATAYERKTQQENTRLNAELGLRNSKEMANVNYNLNERAADSADQRTRNLFNDLYSPKAKVQQLKEAGLNVGLMYGGSGAGGSSSTSGAQGGSSTGLNYPGIQPGIHLELGNLMQDIALKAAQTKLINEQAKTEAGENKRGAAEIQNFGEDIKNKRAQRELIQAQTKMQQAATIAQQMTNEITEDTFYEQCELIRQNLYQCKESVRSAVIQNGIQEATSKTQIDTYNANLQLIYKDLLLKDSQLKLNDKQAEEISSQIFLNLAKTLETNSQTAKNYNDMIISRKQLRVEQFRTAVDAITKAAGVAKDVTDIPIRILDAIIPF